MKIKTRTQIGRAKTRKSGALAGLLVVLTLALATAAPGGHPTLYAAPSMSALSGHTTMSLAHDEENFVSRGRLAQQVANAAGYHDDPGEQIFEDVPPDSHFYTWVNILANRGVISGVACGTVSEEPCVPPLNRPYFRPDTLASRGQIAKVISNAAAFSDAPSGQTFQDVPPGSTFYEFVERLASRGLIDGYACGTAPAGDCVEPDNLPYFLPFDQMTMSDLVQVVNGTFHGDGN